MFKVISLDIDGTIKGSNGEPSLFTKQVLNECVALGAVIYIATGRSLKSARLYTDKLDMISNLISFQGALVTNSRQDDPIWKQTLSFDYVKVVLEYLKNKPFRVLAYVGDDIYVEKTDSWVSAYGERNRVEIREIDSLTDIGSSIYRILAVGHDDEIATLESDMREKFSGKLYVTRSLPHFCEILSNKSGKDKALAWLCSQNGYLREEVIAFGNGFNDVEMLGWAGRGVAIKGSEEPAILVSDDIAGLADEEGVAVYLKTLLDMNQIGGI
tara:strand:- start:958 stop:1767 length:810 start_codon:yes stop_codon:yes gene_type:complete